MSFGEQAVPSAPREGPEPYLEGYWHEVNRTLPLRSLSTVLKQLAEAFTIPEMEARRLWNATTLCPSHAICHRQEFPILTGDWFLLDDGRGAVYFMNGKYLYARVRPLVHDDTITEVRRT